MQIRVRKGLGPLSWWKNVLDLRNGAGAQGIICWRPLWGRRALPLAITFNRVFWSVMMIGGSGQSGYNLGIEYPPPLGLFHRSNALIAGPSKGGVTAEKIDTANFLTAAGHIFSQRLAAFFVFGSAWNCAFVKTRRNILEITIYVGGVVGVTMGKIVRPEANCRNRAL